MWRGHILWTERVGEYLIHTSIDGPTGQFMLHKEPTHTSLSLCHPLYTASTHPSIYSPTHLSTHPFTHPLTYALIHLPTHSLIHPPTHPLIHPPTHSLIHLLTHSSTYLLTHLPFSLSSPSLSLSMHSTVSQTRPWTGVQPPLLLNTFDHSNIPLLQT